MINELLSIEAQENIIITITLLNILIMFIMFIVETESKIIKVLINIIFFCSMYTTMYLALNLSSQKNKIDTTDKKVEKIHKTNYIN